MTNTIDCEAPPEVAVQDKSAYEMMHYGVCMAMLLMEGRAMVTLNVVYPS